MRFKRTLAVASTAALLTVAACGGSDDGTDVDELSAEGVPPDTSTFPMPEAGKAYNNPQPRDEVQDGGTLTLPIGTLGPNFNGFNVDGKSVYNAELAMWTQPMLWDFDVKGNAKPNPEYLESVEQISDDPQTIKYTVNPDAKWNDGTPIDWRSFKTTWQTSSGDSRYNPGSTVGYDSIGSVQKGEKANEVVVTFKEDFYPYEMVFASLLHPKNSDPTFYKEGWVNSMNPDLLAGPYTVDELSKDTLTLKPNPKWWGDKPKLDAVEYRQMEPSASINAFANGQIDVAQIDTEDRLEQIKDMDDVQVRRGFDKSTAVYTFGQDSELFKDEAARRAFVIGTDRAQISEIVFKGLDWEEEPPGSNQIFTWQDDVYEDNLGELGEYDPEKAKEILDEAGWEMNDDGVREKDGQVAEFTYVNFGDDPVAEARARAQQKMSEEIGLKMKIDNRPAADFSKALTDRDFDVVMMGWSSEDPFGWVWACQIFCSDSESNYSKLGTKEIDKLLKEAPKIKDKEKAVATMNEAETKALDLVGTFPLYNGPKMEAVKEGLANYAGTDNGGLAGFSLPHAADIGWQK